MIECKENCCRCPEYGTCDFSQEKLIKNLFSKYGSYHKETSDKVIRIYEQHPEQLHTQKDVLNSLKRAQSDIDQLAEVIEELKAYRIALTERYNFLEISPMKKKIKLLRKKRYQDKVYYYLLFYSVNLSDGHEELTDSIKFSGKDRKKAIDEFERLKSSEKNTIFEKDIENRPWE